MKKLLLATTCLWATSAQGQFATTTTTAPVGDNTNRIASTAFVQNPGNVPIASGTACPSNLQTFAPFANTTSAPTGVTLNIWDGTQCVPWATLNQTAHTTGLTPGNPAATWPGTFYTFMATVDVRDPFGVGALATASRSSDWSSAHSPCCTNLLFNSVLAVHDRTTTGPTNVWANYWQFEKTSTATDLEFFGLEASYHNLGATSAIADPFTPNPTGYTGNIRLDSGVGTGTGNPVSAALQIINNGAKYNSGIIVGSNSVVSQTVSSSTVFGAIELPATYDVLWYSAANTLAGALTVDGSNVLQITATGGINLQSGGTGSFTQTSATSTHPINVLLNTTTDAGSSIVQFQKTRSGGNTSSQDQLGAVQFVGFANTALQNSAAILAKQNAASSGSNIPSTIILQTSSAGGQLNQQLAFDQNAHLDVTQSAAAPTANSCAGFSLGTGSNDLAGAVTFTSATSCSITFGAAYVQAAPHCIVSPGSAASTVEVVSTTGGFTATFGTAQTALTYICIGL
jgi:hypothetical protein